MKVFTHLFLGLFLLSVSLAYAKEAIITADKLNVRHAPNGKKIDNLKQNKSVLIIETKDDWSHIAYDGKRGWVSSAYLTLKDPSSQQKQTPIIPKLESDDLRTHCKTEPLSNAKVCMKVSPASLVCLGSTCEIIFTYNVSTSYTGKGFLYVDLDFRAELLFPDGSV